MIKILLTGGSCAGKTQILPILKKFIEKNGFTCQMFSETATDLLNEGVNPSNKDFQEKIFRRQIEKEREAGKKMLIDYVIFDRGFLDQRAYTAPKEFKRLEEKYEALTSNYDLVIHLESNARHTHEKEGRLETKEEAIKLEEVTNFFTSQHPSYQFIPAQKTIEDKARLVCKAVSLTFPDLELFDLPRREW